MAGGGAFTAFAPELFALVGITGNTGLFTTGIYGIVKLVSSFICAFFVVDRLGRKQALFFGISLQIFCSLYLAVYLQTTDNAAQSTLSSMQKHAGTGAVAMIFISGLSWQVVCLTDQACLIEQTLSGRSDGTRFNILSTPSCSRFGFAGWASP